MRLWILSDLRLWRSQARGGYMPVAMPDADVAIVAGDIVEGVEDAITWLARTITVKMPMVYVLGNHKFYGEYLQEARRVAKAQAALVPALHLLDDNAVVIDGVRFLGSTLWTDCMLHAHGERALQRAAMRTIQDRLEDHRQILMEPAQSHHIARNFKPRDALAMHEASVAWLERERRPAA